MPSTLQTETAREDVREAAYRRDAAPYSGAAFSVGPDRYDRASDAALKARAAKWAADMAAYRKSPQHAFLEHLREIAALSYGVEADQARSAMYRGFAWGNPIVVGEVANALLALNGVPGSDARRACAALAEILHQFEQVAA